MSDVITEPMHPDFKKIYDRFQKQYCTGTTKARSPKGGPCQVGKNYYHAWIKKHGYKDDQPIAPQNKDREAPATAVVCDCGWIDQNPTEIMDKCPDCEGTLELLPIFDYEEGCEFETTPEDQAQVLKTMESLIEKKDDSMHMHFLKILQNYQRYWGKIIGRNKFLQWLKKLKLDPTKSYNVPAQYECLEGACQVVKEAFRWLDEDPGLIKYYMEDDEAKYYRCLAITANVSMNDNDYTNEREFNRAAWTLGWRPLNLNHDQDTTLAFPANRVDISAPEDGGCECVIRIHNEREDIQEKIDSGEIAHVSIEGKSRGGQATGKGTAPKNWNYTALGLLETGSSLPGDPVTYLEPLFVNEALRDSLVESLREEKPMDEPIVEDTPIVEGQSGVGAQGIQICGMCKFFEDLTNTTVKNPAVTGAHSDAFVTITQGGIAPGAGICLILNRAGLPSLVRKADAACTDGRLRDTPTDVTDDGRVDRTTEMLHEVELLRQRADLTEANQDLAKKVDDKTAELSSTREKLTKALDKIKKLTKETASVTKSTTALQKDLDDTREERDKAQDKIRDLEVTVERRDEDIKALREKVTRIEEDLDKLKVNAARLKEDLSTSRRQTADESEKRAASNEKSQNLALEAARLRDELADVTEQVAKLTREVYESAQLRADQAKRMVTLERENGELKKNVADLTKQIKEAHRKVKQATKKLVIKL